MDGKIGVEELNSSGLLSKYDNSWEREPTPAQKKMERRKKE